MLKSTVSTVDLFGTMKVEKAPFLPYRHPLNLRVVYARVKKNNPTWTTERLDVAEQQYREFLAHCRAAKGEHPVPNKDVDEFWHAHILHTKKYMQDCKALFGYFFHHEPLVKDACRNEPGGPGCQGPNLEAKDCQGGGDGCTGCGSGCSGGGTIN